LLLCLTVAKVDSIGFVVRTSQTTHAQLAAWIRGHWLMEGRLHRRRVRLGALRSPHPDPPCRLGTGHVRCDCRDDHPCGPADQR